MQWLHTCAMCTHMFDFVTTNVRAPREVTSTHPDNWHGWGGVGMWKGGTSTRIISSSVCFKHTQLKLLLCFFNKQMELGFRFYSSLAGVDLLSLLNAAQHFLALSSPSSDHSFHLCSVVVMTVVLEMCPAGPHKPLPRASETPLIFLRGVWPFKLINRSRCANSSHHIHQPRMLSFFFLHTGELWMRSHVSSCVALVSSLLSPSSPYSLTVWVWSVTC